MIFKNRSEIKKQIYTNRFDFNSQMSVKGEKIAQHLSRAISRLFYSPRFADLLFLL